MARNGRCIFVSSIPLMESRGWE